MKKTNIKKIEVPQDAMNSYEFAPLDYADAFRVKLPEDLSLSMTEMAYHVFGEMTSYPVYVQLLLKLRDLMVKPFGLYTASDTEEITDHSDWNGFFRIYQTSKNEIIIGGDDKHLDVRVSLLKTIQDDKPFLTVSTFVRLNNLLGKVYFTIIKPFHKIIVPSTIKKSMRNTINREGIQ
jgi:hypothetical protein